LKRITIPKNGSQQAPRPINSSVNLPQNQNPKPTGTVRSLAKKPEVKKVEPPKPVEKETPPKPPEPVAIKPVEKEAPHDLNAQLELIRRVCPSIKVIEQIPEPRGPQKVVIVCDLNPFWEKVAGALVDRGIVVEVIGIDGEISEADLILMPRSLKRMVDGTDTIQTEETPLYLKDTYLKKVLWQTLCSKLGL